MPDNSRKVGQLISLRYLQYTKIIPKITLKIRQREPSIYLNNKGR
jgi:hypothetical protein